MRFAHLNLIPLQLTTGNKITQHIYIFDMNTEKQRCFKMRSVLALLAVATLALADITRYDGYKVYSVTPQNEVQASLLKSLENVDAYDFWADVRRPGHASTVMVAPTEQENFKTFLKNYGISYETLIEDVQTTIGNERLNQAKTPNGKISFSEYNTVPQIEAYLQKLASSYPDIVTLDTIGYSSEQQHVYVLKISSGGASKKPVILIDAGIHAREWIAPATALYIVQELVENESNRNLIKNVDWHIIPILNPDGYKFSYTNDRFWRKTRSQGSQCYGADGNRNFDFHWMETGASSSECDETYAGPRAFSEPETAALRDYVLEHSNHTTLYLTLHSFGELLLYPWGYTSALPEDVDILDSLGRRVAAAIAAVDGTIYTVGSSTNVLYPAAGGSDDYVKAVGGVALSYTIELQGGGSFGFDLPTSSILPAVQETFEGVKEFHAYIEEEYASK